MIKSCNVRAVTCWIKEDGVTKKDERMEEKERDGGFKRREDVVTAASEWIMIYYYTP